MISPSRLFYASLVVISLIVVTSLNPVDCTNNKRSQGLTIPVTADAPVWSLSPTEIQNSPICIWIIRGLPPNPCPNGSSVCISLGNITCCPETTEGK